MEIVLDTSAIIGLMDRDCKKHLLLKEIITDDRNLFIIPSPVIPEICYMLNKRFGVNIELLFLGEIIKNTFQMETLNYMDMLRAVEILGKYKDLNIGYVDASIVAVSERLKMNKILTLDKKHFAAVAPKGFDSFDILI